MNELAEADRATAAAEGALKAQTSVPTSGAHRATTVSWWSTQNAMTMCSLLLLFSVTVLFMASYLIRLNKSSGTVLQTFGTILVITMATFLVVAGYSDQQVAAPLGLLGTIAGYLLGRGGLERRINDLEQRHGSRHPASDREAE